jgi:hypothetical protein
MLLGFVSDARPAIAPGGDFVNVSLTLTAGRKYLM